MSLRRLVEKVNFIDDLDSALIPESVDQEVLTTSLLSISNIIEREDAFSQIQNTSQNPNDNQNNRMSRVTEILERSYNFYFNLAKVVVTTYNKPEYESMFVSSIRCVCATTMCYFPHESLEPDEKELLFEMVDILLTLAKNEEDRSPAKVFSVNALSYAFLYDDVATYAIQKGVQTPIIHTLNRLYERVDKLFLPYPNITYPAIANLGPDFKDTSNSFMDLSGGAQQYEDMSMLSMRGNMSFDLASSNPGISPLYSDIIKTEPSRPQNTTTSTNRVINNDKNANYNSTEEDDEDVNMSDNTSGSLSPVTIVTSGNGMETPSPTGIETDTDDNNNTNSNDDNNNNHHDHHHDHHQHRHENEEEGNDDNDDDSIDFFDDEDLYSDSEDERDTIPNVLNSEISKERLLQLEIRSLIQVLYAIGEYQEVIPVLFESHGFDTILCLLRSRNPFILSDTLHAIGRLLAHNKFGREFVEHGGLRLLFSIPCVTYLSGGLAASLAGFSSNLQVIEQICLLPNPYPTRLIGLGVQLIGMTDYATKMISLFFSEALTFRALTEIFEDLGGLEILIRSFENATRDDKRDIAANLALCIRQYFRTCFLLRFYAYKLGVVRQSETDIPGTSAPIPGYKSVNTEARAMEDALEMLETMRRSREHTQQGDADGDNHYHHHHQQQQQHQLQLPPPLLLDNVEAFKTFLRNNGMKTALKAIEIYSGSGSSLSEDLLQYCLEALHVITFIPEAQNALIEPISADSPAVGMAAVLNAARREDSPSIMIAALNVIVNCVCSQQNTQQHTEETNQMNVWSCLRNLDGVNLFIKLLNYSRHMDYADEVHKLACRALLGMTCDQPVSQILTTLDISSILAGPLKQPAHPDKTRQYEGFRQYGVDLISKITGHIPTYLIRDATDTAQKKMERASIVSKTAIKYNKQELLQVVHDFLVSSGLQKSASALAEEAKLTNTNKAENNAKEHPQALNNIVTQYLRNQHEQCSHPIAVLPPFSLFEKHKCPEPHEWYAGTDTAPPSITSRLFQRELAPPHGGFRGRKLENHFVHSRFKHIKSVDNAEQDSFITSSCIYDIHNVLIGYDTGRVYLWDIWSDKVVQNWEVFEGLAINDIRIIGNNNDRQQRAIFSFNGTRREEPCCVVCDLADKVSMGKKLLTFDGAYAVRYSNDKRQIVATREELAVIHDAETGNSIRELTDARHVTDARYSTFTNIASFSPNDSFVLNDNILWDPRAPRLIHKFDKFTNYGSGYFNPRGTDVIINSEIWDLRTFKLINTCPSLLHAHVEFNATGEVIYSVSHKYNDDPRRLQTYHHPYRPCFCTIDASDFSLISSTEIDGSIIHLSLDRQDNYVTVVEDDVDAPGEESHCRIFEIGNHPTDDDADGDEGDDDDDEISVDSGSDLMSGSDDDIDIDIDDSSVDDGSDLMDDSDSDDWEDDEDDEDEENLFDAISNILISHTTNNNANNNDNNNANNNENNRNNENNNNNNNNENNNDNNNNNENDRNNENSQNTNENNGRRGRRSRRRQLDFHERDLNDN